MTTDALPRDGADDPTVKMTFAFQHGVLIVLLSWRGTAIGLAMTHGWARCLPWAGTNRSEELAQVDFQHQTKGADIVVKVCQEYADTLK